MSLASIRAIAAIHEITGPWLRITAYRQARDNGGLWPEGPYSFEAEVRPDEAAPLNAEWGTAAAVHETRLHLLGRADDALAALAAAGWTLREFPRLELDGRINCLGEDDDGRPREPVLHGLSLKLHFTVDRAYTREERSMDPDVIASEILGVPARGE